MLRPARVISILAVLVVTFACETVRDPFPPQGSLNLEITDTNVASQRAPLPDPQVVIWTIGEMSVHNLTAYDGTYAFLASPPCTYQLNTLVPIPVSSACRTSGLSLQPGTPSTAVMRISISSLQLRAAARPDIATGADPDGDGIPNASDNCPIVFNPGQENVNETQETIKVGDACSDLDSTQSPTIPDQDLDGIRDAVDNCLWYPNPLGPDETVPTDSNRDGIGDACERIAPVVFPGGRLTLECPVTFVPLASKVAIFRLDFGRAGVLTCDAGFTGCVVNPAAIKLERFGTGELFDCVQVP